jgi:hypothetical protein
VIRKYFIYSVIAIKLYAADAARLLFEFICVEQATVRSYLGSSGAFMYYSAGKLYRKSSFELAIIISSGGWARCIHILG